MQMAPVGNASLREREQVAGQRPEPRGIRLDHDLATEVPDLDMRTPSQLKTCATPSVTTVTSELSRGAVLLLEVMANIMPVRARGSGGRFRLN
jgi:hypothetical protein